MAFDAGDFIVRHWLFLLLKEGCGHNSYSLEHPQAYTFTDLLWVLSWQYDWGGPRFICSGLIRRTCDPQLHTYCRLSPRSHSHNFPVARVRQGAFDQSRNRTRDLLHLKILLASLPLSLLILYSSVSEGTWRLTIEGHTCQCLQYSPILKYNRTVHIRTVHYV